MSDLDLEDLTIAVTGDQGPVFTILRDALQKIYDEHGIAFGQVVVQWKSAPNGRLACIGYVVLDGEKQSLQ